MYKLMQKAYEQMPPIFTGYEFGKTARGLGVPEYYTRKGRIAYWIAKHHPDITKVNRGTYQKAGVLTKKSVLKTEEFNSAVEAALGLMPKQFTGKQIADECRLHGGDEDRIRQGRIGQYLISNGLVKRISSGVYVKVESSSEPSRQVKTSDPIKDAIELLKSNGYRVMKPVTDFIEI
jgi:hypothetical protein